MAWDARQHPRWPPGTAGGLGGKFMPKAMAGTPQWVAAVNAQISKTRGAGAGAGAAPTAPTALRPTKSTKPAGGSGGGLAVVSVGASTVLVAPKANVETPAQREKRVLGIVGQHRHLDTDRVHKPNGRWSTGRAQEHKKIVDALMRRYKNVPTNREAIMVGGLAGAGKTTTLGSTVNPDDYIMLNPDDLKVELARRGLVPDIQGHRDLSPLERSTLIHEESRHLTDMLAQRAYKAGKNVAWDVAMNVAWATQGRVSDLRRHGYQVSGLFVDVDVDTALARSSARYAADQAAWRAGKGQGGRPIPPQFITQSRQGRSTVNLGVFRQLRGLFDSWRIYDNRGSQPVLVRKS